MLGDNMTDTTLNTAAWQVLQILPLAMRVITAEFRRMQSKLVPPQLGVLFLLAHHSYNLSELAERHAVSLPTMSNTVSKLVELGLVQRTPSAQDRRMVLIEITPEGLALLRQLASQMLTQVTEVLRPLPPDALTQLSNGLLTLQQAFGVTSGESMQIFITE